MIEVRGKSANKEFELKSLSELMLWNCSCLRECLNQYCTKPCSMSVHAWIMSNNMSAQSFDTHIVDSIMELIFRKKRELTFLSAKHQFQPHFPLIVKSECQSIGHNKSQCIYSIAATLCTLRSNGKITYASIIKWNCSKNGQIYQISWHIFLRYGTMGPKNNCIEFHLIQFGPSYRSVIFMHVWARVSLLIIISHEQQRP